MSETEPTGLRIFLFGNRGYTSRILESFLARGENVVGICTKNDHQPWKARVKDAARAAVISMGLYWKDEFFQPGPFARFESPRRIAERAGVSVFCSKGVRSEEFEASVKNLDIDLMLIAGFHRLIPNNIIQAPRIGIVNLHPSLLPKHRGGTPSRWVIRNGERETGITAHLVTEKFDRGDILLQERIPVEENDTWGDLEDRMAACIPELAGRVLQKAKTGRLTGTSQNADEASYEKPMKGEKLEIDWTESAENIRRLCYSVRPLTGGMTCIGDRRLCVWDVGVLEEVGPGRRPGEIREIDSTGCPVVECGDGGARITRFLDRGRVVEASTVVRRIQIQTGAVFGIR